MAKFGFYVMIMDYANNTSREFVEAYNEGELKYKMFKRSENIKHWYVV